MEKNRRIFKLSKQFAFYCNYRWSLAELGNWIKKPKCQCSKGLQWKVNFCVILLRFITSEHVVFTPHKQSLPTLPPTHSLSSLWALCLTSAGKVLLFTSWGYRHAARTWEKQRVRPLGQLCAMKGVNSTPDSSEQIHQCGAQNKESAHMLCKQKMRTRGIKNLLYDSLFEIIC